MSDNKPAYISRYVGYGLANFGSLASTYERLVITLLINVAAGVAIFFFMLLAMNGFNESDAEYGLGAYIALAALVTLLMSTGAAVLVHILLKRNFRPITSALIAIPVFSVVGVVLKIVCSIVGIMIAEYVRVNY